MMGNVPAPRAGFTFYATFDVDGIRSYIPEETSVLLPASSWARVGLKKPHLPAGIMDRAADSGGFVAAKKYGGYRYSLDAYVDWLSTWGPRWAATMDLCCERELEVVTRERQEITTANTAEAWSRYRCVPWAWVPTVQGLYPDDYRRHAQELRPLLEEMQAFYAGNPAWRVGVGTLCHRNDVVMVEAILQAVREVLPGMPLHLWGIKLDALRSIDLAGVVSTDSAAWHGKFGSELEEMRGLARRAEMSIHRYSVMMKLPAYVSKVYAAVEESRRVMEAQADGGMLAHTRFLLKQYGWTLRVVQRRNRSFAYATRKRGGRQVERYVCAVSELGMWSPARIVAQLQPVPGSWRVEQPSFFEGIV